MRPALRIALTLLAALLLLALVLAANAARQRSRQIEVAPVALPAVDAEAAARRLAGGVRLRTVTAHNGAGDPPAASAEAFRALHAHLAQHYPRAHAALARETVGGFSLLYTWPGSDPAARPIMLMAHQDVVPVSPGTEPDWQVEPFSGAIRDGFVWGRGAWDDKGNLFAMMEAVEALLARGVQPRRTVYLAFGHDEEAGGERGARAIAALLTARGVRLEFVLDEGLLITEGLLAGLARPLALIGVAEKGILTVQVSTRVEPGHSSQPPADTAIGMLARALARLEDRQLPAAVRGVAAQMFETIAPEMGMLNRVLLSNLWLTAPLVKWQLARNPSTNALLRTTTALTVVQGGDKENVLPARADAIVNFRLMPGDTQASVIAHARQAVDNDAVRIERAPASPGNEASPVSPTDAPGYRLIERTVRELFPGTVVAPGLMIGGTDSRHMMALADQVYRFSPVRARREDLARFHGTDERIAVRNLAELIGFYQRLIEQAR